MTLNQSQGNKTYNENVDPKQGHNHAKFERPGYDSVQEKQSEKICQFPLNMCKNKNSGMLSTIVQSFNLMG